MAFGKNVRGRPLFSLLLILVLIAAAGCAGYFGHDKIGSMFSSHSAQPSVTELMDRPPDEVVPISEESVVSVWYVTEVLAPASDLITLRYNYTDADVFENYKQISGLVLPLTTNKTIFTYSGVVSVGFDFACIGIRVNNEAKEITLSLPEPKVVANEIDAASFKYYDVTSSVFNPTTMGDVTELIAALKEKKLERVMADEDLMRQATDNAQTVLRGFLNASEQAGDYTVIFKTHN